MNVRGVLATLGFGLIGAAVCTVFQYVRIILIPTYPPLNLVIGLLISSTSGFLCYGLVYILYSRNNHELGSLFGSLGGAVSGAATGIGYILSADLTSHGAMDLMGNAFFGAIVGGFIGMILGITFFPWIARNLISKL